MRTVFPLALTVLALAACAPEGEGKDKERAPNPLNGFDLASAKDAAGAAQGSIIDLPVEALAQKRSTRNIRLIDVRTSEEVAQGTIPGAEHIPLDEFDPGKLDLSDGREVILYCRSGRRSRIAGEQLAAHTGQPATHLDGGILAWQAAGKPLE